MSICNLSPDWEDLVVELSKKSDSTAFAIFNSNADLICANNTMCNFLGTNTEDLDPENKFINPNLDQILSSKSTSELIFEGLLTIGNYADKHFVLNSKIYKRNNTFLVFAEADVLHLFEENGKMSRLNQEVNNLQRQLIKEKRTLQQTLNKLKETQQQLIHSEKMNALGQMIAGVAHEINNPIAFVLNNLYQLDNYTSEYIAAFKELEIEVNKNASPELKSLAKLISEKNEIDYLTDDIGEIINESKSGVERVKKIVEDLRKFSRLDESKIKSIDLTENIKSNLTIIQTQLNEKNIQFNFISPDFIKIDCYPGQLNQAILNILINAIQAVAMDGNISLVVEEADNSISISVEDNGIGMNEETIKKMFDPFYTTKPVGTGTGLGLSITYKIIEELHKGKIEVKSEINLGTIIKFIIPKETKI